MMITSSKKTTETRYARVDAENNKTLTLDEVEMFVRTARASEIPGDTQVLTRGAFIPVPVTIESLAVTATVEVEA